MRPWELIPRWSTSPWKPWSKNFIRFPEIWSNLTSMWRPRTPDSYGLKQKTKFWGRRVPNLKFWGGIEDQLSSLGKSIWQFTDEFIICIIRDFQLINIAFSNNQYLVINLNGQAKSSKSKELVVFSCWYKKRKTSCLRAQRVYEKKRVSSFCRLECLFRYILL